MARRIAAGFLAGVSSVAGFFALLLLFFFSTGIWTLLHETAIQAYGNIPFGEIFVLAFGQMLATIPRYFWSGRWAMLALGCLGILLALAERQRLGIRRPWRNRLGFVVAVGALVAVSVAFQYANRAAASKFALEQPALVESRALALGNVELLVLWSVVGTLLALPVWFAWLWWYQRWSAWLGAPDRQAASASFAGDDYRWREHQERMAWLKTGAWDDRPSGAQPAQRTAMATPRLPALVAGLLGATLLICLALRWHAAVEPALVGAPAQSGLHVQAASAAVGLVTGLWVALAIVILFELAIAMSLAEETLQDE